MIGYAGKLSAAIRFKTALRTDERVRFMDEIISGVQVIKMYAWEKPFAKLISEARRLELKMVLKNAYVRALYMTFTLFTTRMALFCTILSILLMYGRENIMVSKIFMISYLFSAISHAMCQTFVRGIAEMGEALVSFKRLQMFLEYEEKEQLDTDSSEFISSDQLESRNIAVLMKNVSAGWSDGAAKSGKLKIKKKVGSYKSPNSTNSIEQNSFRLQEIDCEVPKGKLVFVVGTVGAGKSTLLQVLLKELPIACGSVGVNGSVSYSSQESWIFTSTIRQNITFGQPLDRMRYDEIVKCTALAKDFGQLSAGDLTLVGENGTGLSGGQKSRIKYEFKKENTFLSFLLLIAMEFSFQSGPFTVQKSRYLFNRRSTQRCRYARSNTLIQQLHRSEWVFSSSERNQSTGYAPGALLERGRLDYRFEKCKFSKRFYAQKLHSKWDFFFMRREKSKVKEITKIF